MSDSPSLARRIGLLAGAIAVSGVLYMGRICALAAGFMLVYAMSEGAWGPAGVFGMVAALGSIGCGIASVPAMRRQEPGVLLVVVLGVGATVLMAGSAALVAVATV